MSQGEVRYQHLHLCLPQDHHFFWGYPLRMYHHRFWEKAKADVSRKGEELPVLRGGLVKGRGHKISAPDHADVRFWGL